MPVHVERDPELTRQRLAAWLSANLAAGGPVELSDFSGNEASGFSNETLIFDVSFTHEGEPRTTGMVVRVEPVGHQVFQDTAFRTQYEVMSALAERTDIPVPTLAWFVDDHEIFGAPFFVMERIDGRVPTDSPPYHVDGWMFDVEPDDRARLWWSAVDVLAEIHRVDLEASGLAYIPAVGLAAQVDAVRRYTDWVAQGRVHPIVERGLAWLAANVPADDQRDALLWGDARIGNMIFGDDFSCRAVLDWEMVSIGDPRIDLAWFLFLDRHHSDGLGVERLAGFPSPADTVDRWEERTGRTAGDLTWFEVLAGVRFTAIMLRVIDLVIAAGVMPEDATMGFDNPCSALTARILDDLGA
jgi:aminoglycoside phosphotransferase (APT) family kinase protein